jgi:pantoate--beta-alanine ligase
VICRKVLEMQKTSLSWKAAGLSVGVVPTMGALHEGHLSLVAAAKQQCDRVIVTIFVNPTQFNNTEDLTRYPRTEAADTALLASHAVDVIFAPAPEDVYPLGFASQVTVAGVADPLEGRFRPGHFAGVATVVAKLFGMTLPDRAYFGEKDWQQVQVIARMTADLNLNVALQICATARASDGMALSSRNARLSPADRAIAGQLHPVMRACAQDLIQGQATAQIVAKAQKALIGYGFEKIDYFTYCDGQSLVSLDHFAPNGRLLVAAWLSGVRLIDNVAV